MRTVVLRQFGIALLAALVGLAPLGAAAHQAAAAVHTRRAVHACGLPHAHVHTAPHPADCPLCALASRRAPVPTAAPFTFQDTRHSPVRGLRARRVPRPAPHRARERAPPAPSLA